MERVWVAELRVSRATAAKVDAKHGISAWEVRDALVGVEGLRGVADEHPVHGRRLILQVPLRGRAALVVLFEVQHPLGDVWNLGSVYFRAEGA